jgi:hypothetical protein
VVASRASATAPEADRHRRPVALVADFATAVDAAFGRWDLSHLHAFELGDDRVIGYPDDSFEPDVVWVDHATLKVAREVNPGDEFEYVFDLGDNWRHRCVVARDKADPVKEYGHVPQRPVAIWGWGSIPDQYGRLSFDGDQGDCARSLSGPPLQLGIQAGGSSPDRRRRDSSLPRLPAPLFADGLLGRVVRGVLTDAEDIERVAQLGGVAIDAEGARTEEFVLAVAAGEQADRKHPCAAGGQQVPDRVADDKAVLGIDAEAPCALEEQIGLGLRAADVAAFDHHHVGGDAESGQRGVDLWASAGGGDAVRDASRVQLPEQVASARQRATPRQQLAEDLAVTGLDRAGLILGDRAPEFARDGAREEPAAHADAAVDAPAVDRHVALRERSLPSEHVGVDGVDERAVEVEDQRGHARTVSAPARRRPRPRHRRRPPAQPTTAYAIASQRVARR